MIYKLIHKKHGQIQATEDWKGTFGEAKEYMRNGVADDPTLSYELLDENGRYMWQEPRMLRGGSS